MRRPQDGSHALLIPDVLRSRRALRMNVLAYVHLRNIYRSTGVGRVSRELAEHLAQRPDVHLRVLADRQDHAKIVHKVGPPWTGFDYACFSRDTSKQQLWWVLANAPKAEQYWPEADIVYCTAESYVPTQRARLVVTSHDMQLFEPGAHAMSRWLLQQRMKWWLLFQVLADQAHLFHAISTFSAERMGHYFPKIASRIAVIPNAVSQAFFEPPSAAGRVIYHALGVKDTPYLLVPGGLHFRKNANVILEAWPQIQRRCPELKLVIAGHNAPLYAEHAKTLPGIILAGFQEEAPLVALYRGAAAVWFPSRYEGFGMPVLEAMACGTPVITSDITALPEVAGGAAAALVSPDRPADHVDAITGLLQDSGARARAVARGHARARHFTWARSTDQLVAAFRQLL